jgi:hypothetical protein
MRHLAGLNRNAKLLLITGARHTMNTRDEITHAEGHRYHQTPTHHKYQASSSKQSDLQYR